MTITALILAHCEGPQSSRHDVTSHSIVQRPVCSVLILRVTVCVTHMLATSRHLICVRCTFELLSISLCTRVQCCLTLNKGLSLLECSLSSCACLMSSTVTLFFTELTTTHSHNTCSVGATTDDFLSSIFILFFFVILCDTGSEGAK